MRSRKNGCIGVVKKKKPRSGRAPEAGLEVEQSAGLFFGVGHQQHRDFTVAGNAPGGGAHERAAEEGMG